MKSSPLFLPGLLFVALVFPMRTRAQDSLTLSLRYRKETAPHSGTYRTVTETARWNPHRTAMIICDMWDRHWCKGATRRVEELAPVINRVVSKAREQGVFIIHAPSDTMKFYAGTPQRLRAQRAPKAPVPKNISTWQGLDPAKEPPLPIDDSDGGCNDDPQCPGGSPWKRQIALIRIAPQDAVSDDGAEVYNLLQQHHIDNVILMGVHANMCVLGRPFSIRRMVGLGKKIALMRDLTDTMYNSRRPPYVNHFRGTDLVVAHIETYWCPSITSDQILGGEPFQFAEDKAQTLSASEKKREASIRLPSTDFHGQRVKGYVESTPEPDYRHASEAAYEAFRDMKFGVRIHWGLYSIDAHESESWPFLGMSNAQKQAYQEQYKTWNPTGFNAEEWMQLFDRAGLKCLAFTAKHHEGFSMFDTHTRVRERVNWAAPDGPKIESCDVAYSIMETPFKRDVVKEICDAAHKHGIKIDLYFSHPDWYDADFRPFNYHPLQTSDGRDHPEEYGDTFKETKKYVMAPDKTPAETERMIARHRAQLEELLTRYGKIDMMCLDQWMGASVWPQMRETMKRLRKLQPDVMFRCRGIGNYGDYYTPEGFVPGAKENTEMPWMTIYSICGSMSYVADPARYKDGDWVIKNLVDTVAKGGNFMVGIGPDRNGRFHPKAVEALEYTGKWLKVNGEAIYATRPRAGLNWKEGDAVRFTRSKDGKTVYAFTMTPPGKTLQLTSVQPAPGATITLLGLNQPLNWHLDENKTLIVDVPAEVQNTQPSQKHIWVLKIPVAADTERVAATP